MLQYKKWIIIFTITKLIFYSKINFEKWIQHETRTFKLFRIIILVVCSSSYLNTLMFNFMHFQRKQKVDLLSAFWDQTLGTFTQTKQNKTKLNLTLKNLGNIILGRIHFRSTLGCLGSRTLKTSFQFKKLSVCPNLEFFSMGFIISNQ